MTDLNRLTIADARDALTSGETTAVELTEACLAAPQSRELRELFDLAPA